MNISTYVFPVNTIEDLILIPDWVVDVIKNPVQIHSYLQHTDISRLYQELNNFSKVTVEQITNLWSTNLQEIKSLISLKEEQSQYFYYYDKVNKEQLIKELIGDFPGLGFEIKEKNCRIWLIITTLNGIPYGAVYAFQNINNSNDIMMQGISKFVVPYLFGLLDPELSNKLPKLNSILIPAVENLALAMNAKRIIVHPIGKQGDILVKHYGFKQTTTVIKPCNLIYAPWSGPSYEKEVVRDF